MTGNIPAEQRRANWFMEAVGGISALGVAGLIWYAAQQSSKIDATDAEVAEVRTDLREIKTTLSDIRTTLATAINSGAVFSRDIERNTMRIEGLTDRMNRLNAFREFRGEGGNP